MKRRSSGAAPVSVTSTPSTVPERSTFRSAVAGSVPSEARPLATRSISTPSAAPILAKSTAARSSAALRSAPTPCTRAAATGSAPGASLRATASSPPYAAPSPVRSRRSASGPALGTSASAPATRSQAVPPFQVARAVTGEERRVVAASAPAGSAAEIAGSVSVSSAVAPSRLASATARTPVPSSTAVARGSPSVPLRSAANRAGAPRSVKGRSTVPTRPPPSLTAASSQEPVIRGPAPPAGHVTSAVRGGTAK